MNPTSGVLSLPGDREITAPEAEEDVASLRNADQAIIEPGKLRGYLLSRTHPVGRFKAIFFRSLGYSVSRWQLLEADLRKHLLANDPEAEWVTPYGRKLVVRGRPEGPGGRSAELVTV